MPVTADTETRDRKKSPPLVWFVPLGLLVALLGLAGVAPLSKGTVRLGPVEAAAGIVQESSFRQGFTLHSEPGQTAWVLRLGDWHWGVGVRR